MGCRHDAMVLRYGGEASGSTDARIYSMVSEAALSTASERRVPHLPPVAILRILLKNANSILQSLTRDPPTAEAISESEDALEVVLSQGG